MLACREHAKPHVFIGRLLDLPRRRHPDGVAVEPQRRHHPWRERPLPTVVLGLQYPLDLSQIDVLEEFEDEVRQMPLRQPLARRGRQQVRLLGRVRPVGLHAAIRSDRISRVDRFLRRALVTARARWRVGPPAERERGARGTPAEWREAHTKRGSPVVTAQRSPGCGPGGYCEAEKPGVARLCDRVRGGTPSTAPARTTRRRRPRAHVGARDLWPTHS
jgi:hypothetical protein